MIISSEAAAYKPSPVIAKAALKFIPKHSGPLLMIGDSPDDVGVAQEMGAHSILIRDTPNHNAAVQPTWQVNRLTDISRLLWPDQG